MNAIACAVMIVITAAFARADGPDSSAPSKPHRDPFWPIGYSPVMEETATSSNGVNGAVASPNHAKQLTASQKTQVGERLIVSSFMKRGERYGAIINGELVGIGDRLTVDVDGHSVSVIITSIAQNAFKWKIEEP